MLDYLSFGDTHGIGPDLPVALREGSATGDETAIWYVAGVEGYSGLNGNLYRLFLGPDGMPMQDAWTLVTTLPTIRFRPSVRQIGRKIYVAGGNNISGVAQTMLEIYDLDVGAWTTGAPMPSAKVGGVDYMDGDGAWHIVAGYSGASADQSHQVYAVASNSWSTLSDCPVVSPLDDNSAQTCAMDGAVYVYAGQQFWKQSFADQTWTKMPNLAGCVVPGPLAALKFGIVMFGYFDGTQAQEAAFEFNVLDQAWSARPDIKPQKTVGGQSVQIWRDGVTHVYVVAGTDLDKEPGSSTVEHFGLVMVPPVPTTEQALAQAAFAFFPLDGGYDDVLTPNEAITAAGGPVFVDKWDGRKACSLTGSWCQLGLPNRNSSVAGAFTVSLWFRAQAFDQPVPLFYDAHGVMATATQTAIQLSMDIQGGWVLPVPALVAGQWYHLAVAAQKNGNGAALVTYLDGLAIDSRQAESFGQPLVGATIGHGDDPVVAYCNVGLFATAISPAQAAYLASDLFHPEGAYAASIQYFALSPAGGPLTCGDDPVLDQAATDKGITITAWIDTDDIDVMADLGSDDDPMTSPGILISRGSAFEVGIDESCRPYVMVGRGSATQCSALGATAIGASKWAFITATISLSSIAIYVDGVLQAEASPTASAGLESGDLLLCNNWYPSVYSAAILAGVLSATEIQAQALLDEPVVMGQGNLLVHYDLSVSPPKPTSSTPGLAVPITVPAGASYQEYARGLMLHSNACVDGGYVTDTLLDPQSSRAPALLLNGWISPSDVRGRQTIASRYSPGKSGYGLHLIDGFVEAILSTADGSEITARSPFRIPAKRFTQVAALYGVQPGGSQYYVVLCINGRLVAEQTLSPTSPADGVGDPLAPFLIGARSVIDDMAPGEFAQSEGLFGMVQSLQVYRDDYPSWYSLFFDIPNIAQTPVANWMFDGYVPTDTTGVHDAVALNGAAIDYVSAPDVPLGPLPSESARYSRTLADTAADIPIVTPDAHRFILDGPLDGVPAEYWSYHVDGVAYIVWKPIGAEARCVMAADDIDPVTLIWITAAITLLGLLGSYLLNLTFDGGKGATIVTKAVTEGVKVRDALFAFAKATSGTMGGLVLTLLIELYEFGVLRKLLQCFAMSWFSALKFLGYLAPYAGQIILAEQLLEAGVKMYQEFQKTQPKLDVKPPSPHAVASASSITVNGDPITVEVALDGPPPEGGVVVQCTSLNLSMSPSALEFTASNFATPQTVQVTKTSANALQEQDGKPVLMEFGGPGLASGVTIEISQRVAKVAIEPEKKVLLTEDDAKQYYTGDFSVYTTADIPDAAVVSYEFFIDGKPIAETQFAITPKSTLGDKVGGKRKADFTAKLPVSDTQDRKVRMTTRQDVKNQTQPASDAGDGAMIDVEVQVAGEYITLTMVNGKSGNCFILRNEDQTGAVRYALIDGGMGGTYANMTSYLPSDDKDSDAPILMYCSHFDQDHIKGLLELMADPVQKARVQQVFFNPPPAAVTAAVEQRALLPGKIVGSVRQGNQLKLAAAGRLSSPGGYSAPPTTPLAAARMPTIDVKMAGPSLKMLADLAVSISDPKFKRNYASAVNRASLAFLMESRLSGFRFMQTGDGYGSAAHPDLQGDALHPARLAMLHFLQVQHHGSRNNCSETFFRNYPAKNYLISTDFTKFGHPHLQMMDDLFSANSTRPDHWNIYINAEATASNVAAMQALYNFPAHIGQYSVYLRKSGSTGITFTYADNAVAVGAEDLFQLA